MAFGLLFVILLIPKSSITADIFYEKMKEKDYEITDITSQFKENKDYMLKAYEAQKNGYKIKFYELINEDDAINMFETEQIEFESKKGKNYNSTLANRKNAKFYSLKSDGKYRLLSRINNTLIYVNTSEEHEAEIKKDIEEIKYYF